MAAGRVSIPTGKGTLLERLRLQNYHLRADCGGQGNCGRCRVRFRFSPPPPDPADELWLAPKELSQGWRLACRHSLQKTVELEYSDDWKAQLRLEPMADIADDVHPPKGLRLGLAIDIGTTGLVAAIVDLGCGTPLLIARGFNPQRAWGADVMTRLVAARDPIALGQLQAALLHGLGSAIALLKKNVSTEVKWPAAATLAVGNTVMIHLAAGVPESTLSVFPFRSPLENKRILQVDLSGKPFHLAGPLQGYVGSDLLAVLEYLAPHHMNSDPSLIMDLGTNSEIAIWDGQSYWVTSCAAGPAFEGGGISCGAPAGPGVATGGQHAGDHWLLFPEPLKPKTGLCGSALIALLAQLVAAGRMQRNGKLIHKREIVLQSESPRLVLTQKDVRELQLAKGAIHAGIVALARHSGLALADIKKVVVTGAFARDLKAHDLKEIGLVPAAAEDVAFVNDGAVCGAARALAASYCAVGSPHPTAEPFADLRPMIRVINLVEEPDFQERFLAGLELKPMAG